MSSGSTSLVDGLLGYWPFDGNGADRSPAHRDLDIVGAASFGSGLYGQAIALPGSVNAYAVRPINDPEFDFGGGDFTVQVWVNYDVAQTREQTVIEKFTGAGGPGWTFTTLPPMPAYFYGFDQTVIVSDATSTPNVWHHLLFRRLGNQLMVRIDTKTTIVTSTSALSTSPNPLLIGKRNAQDGRDFSVQGRLDEIAIWSRALTDDDISALYNGGMGTPVLP